MNELYANHAVKHTVSVLFLEYNCGVMKMTVKYSSPIREAKNIRIAPLALFVGHGGRRKSYLAMAYMRQLGLGWM